jgi:hypothetical protein
LSAICANRLAESLAFRDDPVFSRTPRVSATGKGDVEEVKGQRRGAKRKVTCEDCYFHCNLLCALALREPCTTFRPNHPDGLRPPSQLRFLFRQERRTQAAWAFPSAQEQAALHA